MKNIIHSKIFIPIVVAGALAAGWGLSRAAQTKKESSPAATETAAAKTVGTQPVRKQLFESRLEVQGNLEAVNLAIVPARAGGTIEALWADKGSVVKAGDKLAQTDAVKLGQAVTIRQRELDVARCARREKEAALAQTKARFDKAVLDFERYKKLLEKEVATQDEFERYESDWKQQQAMCEHSQALLDLAKAQEKQAAVALEMAEKDQQDSFVLAPIDGVVSERMRELGEMAAPGSPVFRVVDNNLLDATAYLPSEYYDRFAPGDAKVRLAVNGHELGEYPVTYRSPDIDPKLRTFEIQARITNAPDFAAAGGMARMQAIMEQREGFGVPRAALLDRGGERVLFVMDGETARQVTVQAGLENDGLIEVTGDGLREGLPVVTSGQAMLNNGDRVEQLNRSEK